MAIYAPPGNTTVPPFTNDGFWFSQWYDFRRELEFDFALYFKLVLLSDWRFGILDYHCPISLTMLSPSSHLTIFDMSVTCAIIIRHGAAAVYLSVAPPYGQSSPISFCKMFQFSERFCGLGSPFRWLPQPQSQRSFRTVASLMYSR